jgi:hypothetical protein
MFQHPHKPRGYLILRVLDYDVSQTSNGYIFMSGLDVTINDRNGGYDNELDLSQNGQHYSEPAPEGGANPRSGPNDGRKHTSIRSRLGRHSDAYFCGAAGALTAGAFPPAPVV